MFSISTIIELIKTGFGLIQKKQEKQESKDELDAQNSHEQNDITMEETRKGFTWRQMLGYVLTFIVFYNYVIIPVLALFGIILPPVPLDQVWKVLIILIGGN